MQKQFTNPPTLLNQKPNLPGYGGRNYVEQMQPYAAASQTKTTSIAGQQMIFN